VFNFISCDGKEMPGTGSINEEEEEEVEVEVN
jgi:hypothetical protein